MLFLLLFVFDWFDCFAVGFTFVFAVVLVVVDVVFALLLLM